MIFNYAKGWILSFKFKFNLTLEDFWKTKLEKQKEHFIKACVATYNLLGFRKILCEVGLKYQNIH